MNPTTRTGGRRRGRRSFAAIPAAAAAAIGVALLSGFHLPLSPVDPPAGGASGEVPSGEVVGIRTLVPVPGVRIDAGVEYGATDDGTLLTLDVCRPPLDPAVPGPAVVSVHGGSWQRGAKDNDDWRRTCEWLAGEGFVAVSIDYRLVPDAVFPAQLDDVQAAVRWLRQPEQLERWGIDPARIGLFGGSAGGQLAALAGTSGSGGLDRDARVAAVVEVSGPVGLRESELDADGASPWLRGIVSAYLGCGDPHDDACGERRTAASPSAHADPSDPPVLVVHGDHELIPLAQSRRFVAELGEAGVDARLEVVGSDEHSIGLLDERRRMLVAAFLHERLG